VRSVTSDDWREHGRWPGQRRTEDFVDSCFIADWSTEQYGLAARNVTDVRHDGPHTCYHADVVGDDLAFVFVEYKAD